MALMETLQDGFNDAQRDPTKWNSSFASQVNGQLYLATSGGLGNQSGYYESKQTYNLTSSYAFSQLISIDFANDQLNVYPVHLELNNSNYVEWNIGTGGGPSFAFLTARKRVAGVSTSVRADTVYDPDVHKYFKIRESGGTIYWDYSTDGTTWTNYTSSTVGFAYTALTAKVWALDVSTGILNTFTIFDNFNVLPTVSVDRSTDNPRQITQSTQISWKKDFATGITAFTIGSSTIGGNDFVGSPADPVASAWNKYKYFDESDYVMGLSWERSLQMPTGGLSIARADITLDNTSGRFLPDYMGGNSELYTAILPRRPLVINAGFHYDGVDNNWPAFVGMNDRQPKTDVRGRQVELNGLDFLEFLQNKPIDNTAMYTGQRIDQIFEDILHTKLGYATAQYEFDPGVQQIPFAVLEAGTKIGGFMNSLAQAELGHIFQDETGVIHFHNRFHWNVAPNNFDVATIYTADVFDFTAPDDSHIINVVEVNASPLKKSTSTTIYSLPSTITLQTGRNEIFIDFDNPVIAKTSDSFTANSSSDGSGTNDTANILLKSTSVFTKTAKYVFENNTGRVSYLTALTITGRWATVIDNIYRRYEDDSSVTAFEERTISVDNDFIQSEIYAQIYARAILDQFSEPESIVSLKIRAKPTLKLGDQVSWQGRSWGIVSIKSSLNPSVGYVQDITLVKRTVNNYFTIGVSIIGSSATIAP